MFLKSLFSFLLCYFALCSARDNGFKDNGGTYGYHVKEGIPMANYVKTHESSATRIVSGSQVSSASVYPFQAGIVVTLTTGHTSICGGSLVSATRVLTAAHCWYDGQSQAREFTVVLGSLLLFTGGTRVVTRDVVLHPSWNNHDITNDIAVVKINKVTLTTNIQPILLPTVADTSLNLAGMTGTASGFGKTSDSQATVPTSTSLHHSTLPIVSNAECQRSFDFPIHSSHLCTNGAGRKGTCDGDSGGPLSVLRTNQRILVGIVSFGLGNGCEQGFPSVFTRVTSFLPWIQANL